MDLKEIGGESLDRIKVAWCRDKWQAVVNMVMNLQVMLVLRFPWQCGWAFSSSGIWCHLFPVAQWCSIRSQKNGVQNL